MILKVAAIDEAVAKRVTRNVRKNSNLQRYRWWRRHYSSEIFDSQWRQKSK